MSECLPWTKISKVLCENESHKQKLNKLKFYNPVDKEMFPFVVFTYNASS